MSDCYIDDWAYHPWDYCDVCGDLLVIHWRGRPCLQPACSLVAAPALHAGNVQSSILWRATISGSLPPVEVDSPFKRNARSSNLR